MTDDDALVEAVARAICKTGPYDPDRWEANGGLVWMRYKAQARAALSAIPLERYRDALYAIRDIPDDGSDGDITDAKEIARKALEGG